MGERDGVGGWFGEDGFVLFRGAGEAAKGEFRCAECGYGVVVGGPLPDCPMCHGTAWEPSAPAPSRRGGAGTGSRPL